MCTVTNTAGLNIHIKEGAAVAIFTGFNEEDTLICDDLDPFAKANTYSDTNSRKTRQKRHYF